MKVLVSICSYSEHEIPYLNKVLDSYASAVHFMDLDISIALCTNYDYEPDSAHSNVLKFFRPNPKYEQLEFIYSTNQFIIDNVDNYDIFIHTDSDVVVTHENINYYITLQDFLKDRLPYSYLDYIPGFLVYELDKNNTKRIISMNMEYPPLVDELLEIAGKKFVVPHNLHSNMNMVDSERLKKAIQAGTFNTNPKTFKGMYYIREYCMTNIYFDCGMKKIVAPLQPGYLVHHTPNKYVTLSDKQITNIDLETNAEAI